MRGFDPSFFYFDSFMEWYEHHHHVCRYDKLYGNWQLPRSDGRLDLEYRLYIQDILHLLTDSRLETIDLCDIAWLGKHHHPYNPSSEWSNRKYQNADPAYPGIILKNAPNPYNNKYRMVDGRHRIMKLLNQGETSSQFYVLDYNDVKQYIVEKVFCPVEKKLVLKKANLS